MERLSLPAARRIALAAQGFAEPRPLAPDRRALGRTLARTQLFQIDSVNVVARAHYLPAFSRLGAYPRDILEEAAWGRRSRRTQFEYWAHEASLLPVELQPLLRWRMERAAAGVGTYKQLARFGVERADYVASVLREVEARGPTTAAELEGSKGAGGWWGWSDAKIAVEWLFWAGRLTTATRRAAFERVYDLPERVLPRATLDTPTPDESDAIRVLLSRSARALGVATAADLRDYFRLSPADADPRIAELVEAGEFLPVKVDGWGPRAFLHRDARRPRRVEARALLAPFDPMVWERSRTERLFGVRVRLEIYTPADKRTHGYYVLPFLLGDTIAARVDLKAERAAGVLRVQAAHAEPGAPGHTAEVLATELRLMAGWLGLERVEVAPRGDMAAALGAETAKHPLPPPCGEGGGSEASVGWGNESEA